MIRDYRGKTAARVVGADTVDGVETRIVTFYVLQGRTSIWYRLWVDDDGRVRRAEMKAQVHVMDRRPPRRGPPARRYPDEGRRWASRIGPRGPVQGVEADVPARFAATPPP